MSTQRSNQYQYGQKQANKPDEEDLRYDSDDGSRKFFGSAAKPAQSQQDKSPQERGSSPRSLEQIQFNLRQEIQLRKEKNEANQQLARFKKCLQKQDSGSVITTSAEKIAQLPVNLKEDLNEAILYLYFSVRYFDEHMYKVILTRTNRFSANKDLNQLLGKDRSFQSLTIESSYSRYRLNQLAFEIALEKDYYDVAFHFIETGQVHITWEMVRLMISRRQEYLVKQCIKYGSRFDPGSASLKKIVFAGRSAAPLEDRAIKLVDFIQVMLDLRWKSLEIQEVLVNYAKKGKIDSVDMRELFLMFALKRKIKLMSFLINNDQFLMEFTEDNFVDVIENDAFDMAVLLYREYFLEVRTKQTKVVGLLVNAFTKTNGMLEAKCFLLKRFISHMKFSQANKFLEAVEQRVNDSSKGNILILTLNAVKATCLLVEVMEKVKSRFSFLDRRVSEIRSKLVSIAQKFMDDIQSEEEMRFYLLEKDLDERDSLNIIYDCEIIELLKNAFSQNIVTQIWRSQYNNSHSIFTVSSVHQLLFNYNHCRNDMEASLRFYRGRDLSQYGCHPFQFQVWRYSGESRHLISSITNLAFVILFHLIIVDQMTYVLDLMDHLDEVNGLENMLTQPGLSSQQSYLIQGKLQYWYMRAFYMQQKALRITFLMFLSWMFIFQHIFDVVYATKNKRYTHLINFGNLLDFAMFLTTIVYLFAFYKDWRYNTFLQILTPAQLGQYYWHNYTSTPISEMGILISLGIILWLRVVFSFKLFSLTAGIFAIVTKITQQMFTFAIFYFAVLFLYSVVGVVLFYDLSQFSTIQTALFTLFNATIQEFNIDTMQNARIGAFLGYVYYLSFLIINLILIMNLIYARLAYAYKQFNERRDVLIHLATLSVREVSEADDKYSAVISAPFPLNMLNFPLGTVVISLKSQAANIALLNLYYLPISSLCLLFFFAYQLLVFPFCYIKIIGHKFALVVKAPQGQGARSTLDRAFQAVLFILIGPLLLLLAMLVDLVWFMIHMYKMDLDKSMQAGGSSEKTKELNRRTYKKMIQYFEKRNEQLVPQKKVAQDLREHLDVMEGIRCMIYGRPKAIPNDKVGLYITYARQYLKEADGKKTHQYEMLEEGLSTKEGIVEQVVEEFEVVKQVLLNNSFPVDMRDIQQNSVKRKGWGMKQLFDKKTFHALLLDLERMRKVLQLKKSLFIFHIPYEGKPKQLTSWHRKVEQRVTQTLKFLNTSRLLKIIGYDPVYHIKMENINLAIGSPEKTANVGMSLGSEVLRKKQSREENLQGNMQFIINKYQNSTRQMRDLSDILRRLNLSNSQLQVQQQLFLAQPEVLKAPVAGAPKRNPFSQNQSSQQPSKQNQAPPQNLNVSFSNDNASRNDSIENIRVENRQQYQGVQANYNSQMKSPEPAGKNAAVIQQLSKRNMNVHYSERSENEAQVESEASDDGGNAGKKKFGTVDEIGISKKRKK